MGFWIVLLGAMFFYCLYEVADAWNIEKQTVDLHRFHWVRFFTVGIVTGIIYAILTL